MISRPRVRLRSPAQKPGVLNTIKKKNYESLRERAGAVALISTHE
jgi:hypothetical protein